MTPGNDLARFVDVHGDFERALSEIQSGRKRTHWMWYVFPQVTGLGASEMARRYAIETVDEAEAFLIHPVLGADYLRIVDEAWRQIVEHGMSVEALLGSPDDAKLVSSLTLFAGVARRLDGPEAALTVFVTRADEILRSAFAEGLRRCAITEGFLQ